MDFDAIKGYSKSEVKFGAHWGQSLARSRSIILYSKDYEPFEFISFNYWAFGDLEDKFRELELPFLGFEEYKTGFLFRKYTFQ